MKQPSSRLKQIIIGATVIMLIVSAMLITGCEKISPIDNLLPDDLEFTCESCHTNEAMLKLLAPEDDTVAGGGG